MAPPKEKLQLPKAILEMKFMKKTKDRIERELANTKKHDDKSDKITNKSLAPDNFISEQSFIFCEDLIEGRVSFKGMNPEIERLMELEKSGKEPNEDMEKDVSDEVLAKKFQSLKRYRQNRELGPLAKKKK